MSGEWVQGVWVDDKALTEQEEVDLAFKQLVSETTLKVSMLLEEAALRIAPLQDAVDIDEATEYEVARLKDWKKYRVALNRIQEQPNYPKIIEWPASPV